VEPLPSHVKTTKGWQKGVLPTTSASREVRKSEE